MPDELLTKLKHFFVVDYKIKKEIYDMAPPQYTDINSLVKYTNEFFKSLKYITTELEHITLDLFNKPEYYKAVKSLSNKIKMKFITCKLDIDSLSKFYKENITNMTKPFIDQVQENCIGYTGYRFPPVSEATTINELLHVLHAAIVNNDLLLRKIPEIAHRGSLPDIMVDKNGPISLRGEQSQIFIDLFNNIPTDLFIGITDMVCISEDQMIMMIRDRGHALTIEVNIEGNKARIEYFIPNITNMEMVKQVPGLISINDNKVGIPHALNCATGALEVDVNNLNNTLYDLISKVPTDMDIIREQNGR
ncbi:MAG: hypothetical protein IKX00_02665 [Bacilli bacterium]|nr:hypothetical protein [Bacilli bacterium]